MLASANSLLGLFAIACGGLVMLALILSRLRAKMVGIAVLLLMMMGLAGAATFMFMPARPVAPGAILVPPIPPFPGAKLPLVSLDADRISIDSRLESVMARGHRAAEIARVKIHAGAEAVHDAAHRITVETQMLVRQHDIPPIPDVALRVVDGVRHARPAGLAATGLMAFAIGAFLYLGYIFLDAGTRGYFTWSLRIVSVVTFAALCLALSVLRHGL